MILNLVVPKVVNLKIEWFNSIGLPKSCVYIEPFSKIEWFHGTTGTTTNAGPAMTHLCTKTNLYSFLFPHIERSYYRKAR